jgi:hypothetical protein
LPADIPRNQVSKVGVAVVLVLEIVEKNECAPLVTHGWLSKKLPEVDYSAGGELRAKAAPDADIDLLRRVLADAHCRGYLAERAVQLVPEKEKYCLALAQAPRTVREQLSTLGGDSLFFGGEFWPSCGGFTVRQRGQAINGRTNAIRLHFLRDLANGRAYNRTSRSSAANTATTLTNGSQEDHDG